MKKNQINEDGLAWCSNHQQWLPTNQFGANKNKPSMLSDLCNTCKSESNAQHNLDHWVVYWLKNGRVGLTNRPYFRMASHRTTGYDTRSYKILAICYCKDEAQDIEALYQLRSKFHGYKADNKTRLN